MKKFAKVVWEPKLEMPSGTPAPDAYGGSNGLIPPDDFIVSRKRDGSVASVYAALVWDVTAYDPSGRSRKLYFASWCNNAPTKKQQRIVRRNALAHISSYVEAGRGGTFCWHVDWLYEIDALSRSICR